MSNKFDALSGELDKAMERIQTQDDGQLRGVATKHTKLDEMLGGFQKSDLIILAARPSVGKTAFAIDIARRVAEQQIPVGIFSLEMSAEQLVQRLLSSETGINQQRLRLGDIKDDEPLFGTGLGLDSIDALDLVSMLEREYGILIDDMEVARQARVGQLYLIHYPTGNHDHPNQWVDEAQTCFDGPVHLAQDWLELEF